MTTVVIGGDVCPPEVSAEHSVFGSSRVLLGDLVEDFVSADLCMVNLECPLTDERTPIQKVGPVLKASPVWLQVMLDAGIDVLGLANNHMLDQGAAGLTSTLRARQQAGIATAGAGMNLAEARQILIRRVNGLRIGILAMAEHEFSMATQCTPGANALDLIDCPRNIRAFRADMDYLIVLLHGGKEGYPFPSPRLMDTCRFLVEQGANAVLCQHSHCVGCYEKYGEGHIVYGQGNLLFDWPDSSRQWNEGVLVRLLISANGRSEIELIPFERVPESGARKMGPAASRALLQDVHRRSERIQDPAFVESRWLEACREQRDCYLGLAFGHGRVLQRLNSRGRMNRFLYPPKALLRARNVVQCETHREALETVFGDLTVERADPRRRSGTVDRRENPLLRVARGRRRKL